MEALLWIAGIAWLIHATTPEARAKRKARQRAKFYKRCFPGHSTPGGSGPVLRG